MKIKKMEEAINEIMDKHSQYLFNKPYYQLLLSEQLKLDQYIKDIANPEWKPIILDGVQTIYDVSNTGEVRNRETGLIRKQKYSRDGYKILNLSIDSKMQTYSIHRLVAKAFIPNPENNPVINHINGKKDFNWVGNLEWRTYAENTQHAITMGLAGRYGTDNPNNKFPEETIHQICKLLESGKGFVEINKIIPGSKYVASGIKEGRIWKDIASKYNIPKPENKLRPEELKLQIIELIQKGYKNREIVQTVGLPDTPFEREYVSLFRRRWLKKQSESK